MSDDVRDILLRKYQLIDLGVLRMRNEDGWPQNALFSIRELRAGFWGRFKISHYLPGKRGSIKEFGAIPPLPSALRDCYLDVLRRLAAIAESECRQLPASAWKKSTPLELKESVKDLLGKSQKNFDPEFVEVRAEIAARLSDALPDALRHTLDNAREHFERIFVLMKVPQLAWVLQKETVLTNISNRSLVGYCNGDLWQIAQI